MRGGWILADRDWLDEETEAIGQYWKRENAGDMVWPPKHKGMRWSQTSKITLGCYGPVTMR